MKRTIACTAILLLAAATTHAAGLDAYTPLAPNAAPPVPANANNLNLVQNIERLKLAVDRILPLHGRIVPLAELYRTVGR